MIEQHCAFSLLSMIGPNKEVILSDTRCLDHHGTGLMMMMMAKMMMTMMMMTMMMMMMMTLRTKIMMTTCILSRVSSVSSGCLLQAGDDQCPPGHYDDHEDD